MFARGGMPVPVSNGGGPVGVVLEAETDDVVVPLVVDDDWPTGDCGGGGGGVGVGVGELAPTLLEGEEGDAGGAGGEGWAAEMLPDWRLCNTCL